MNVVIDADGTWTDANGYVRHGKDKYVHITLAERALGRALPAGAEVHHVNDDRADNSRGNLVICNDHRHHMLMHARARVVRAGGHPELHKICSACTKLLPKEAFSFRSSTWDGRSDACRECTNARRRGKNYSQWNERRAEQQRLRRARARRAAA